VKCFIAPGLFGGNSPCVSKADPELQRRLTSDTLSLKHSSQQELVMQKEITRRLAQSKTIVLATFAAASLVTAFASVAHADPRIKQPLHQGPYDNTGKGPQETGMEGGGG
jgi:hypothetical protein